MPHDLTWKEAIYQVLGAARGPMHYTRIADEISERGLRSDLGATPPETVASTITQSLQKEGPKSPFVRVSRALYALRTGQVSSAVATSLIREEAAETTGLVNAFGMYWERSRVLWQKRPAIWGQQSPRSRPVDFCEQRGVYLLHDVQGVVYVGRADDTLGGRLYHHTINRLNGRWTRFSWFGVYSAEESGSLKKSANFSGTAMKTVISTMEAVLIEGLEPRQNRKRGDDFRAVEFLQAEDPEL
jgi:hypothetical protein